MENLAAWVRPIRGQLSALLNPRSMLSTTLLLNTAWRNSSAGLDSPSARAQGAMPFNPFSR